MVEISESDKTLDVRGLYCPSPVMQTVVELAKMQVGQILVVLADDPAAEDDISDMCRTRGHELVELKKNGNDLEFIIKKIKLFYFCSDKYLSTSIAAIQPYPAAVTACLYL